MKPAILAVALLLLAGCANTDIPMTAEERAQCDAEGGCILITRKALQANLHRMAAEQLGPVYEQGVKDGAAECKKGAV